MENYVLDNVGYEVNEDKTWLRNASVIVDFCSILCLIYQI